jgi:probable rRNA maturation factor
MRTSATRTSRKPPAERRPPALRLTIQNAAGASGLPARSTIRRWLLRALGVARPGPGGAALTVRFVGAGEGRRLNRQFRGRDYATNVLSFGYDAPGVSRARSAAPLCGDIVLCVPVLRREARAQRKPLRAHCAHLVIHGALHLSGFDHEKAKDAKVMEALETGLLDSLGYDDPYATNGESGNRIR